MKKAFKIAKLELSNLFYSPIAWFLLIVFLFQAGFTFTHVTQDLLQSKNLSGKDDIFGFVTSYLFSGWQNSLFPAMLDKLFLYLPLLTMGLISKEVSSGTISLLYSSPLKVKEIVWGKFLAMVGYVLILMTVLVVFGVAGFFFIPHMDLALFFSGLLGVFLLLCTYSAIGLFMSSLTSYQVVAALCTFVVFAALAYVGSIWQGVDFVRDLTYFLSISGRTSKMVGGLITTKDIFYFVLISLMFLSFAVLKLQASRETKPWYVRTGRYIGVFVLVLVLGYLTSRPGYIGYWDVTATKTNTITEGAQKIISQLDGPLEITSYINFLDGHHYYLGSPEKRNDDLDRWEKYIRFKKYISLKYVYYYDDVPDDKYLHNYNNKGKTLKEIADFQAKATKRNISGYLTPPAIQKLIDLSGEQNHYVMQLKYKGRTTFLRIFDDPQVWPSESEISAALKRLTATPPKIGFLQGNYERSIDVPGDNAFSVLTNSKSFRYSLINQGFDMQSVIIDSMHTKIPDGLAALVIADPRKPLSQATLQAINAYIAAGGNMMILGKPGKQQILNPLLMPLGVQLMDGRIIQESKYYSQDIAVTFLTAQMASWTKTAKGIFEDSGKVTLPGTTGIRILKDSTGGGKFNIVPLVMTDAKNSWNRTEGNIVFDSTRLVYDASLGDNRGPFPVVVSLTRHINGKEQRVIVGGDADIMANDELGRKNMGRTANFQFNTELFGWFTYGAFPVTSYRPSSRDHYFKLTDRTESLMEIFFLWILPGFMIVFATILLIRRRRK